MDEDVPASAPPRIVLNATQGFGKTTFGAYAPSPLMVMVGGETGYETLLAAGRVPKCKRVNVQTWLELRAVVQRAIDEDLGIRTLVIDAVGGVEAGCYSYVCARDYNGDRVKFVSFQNGPDTAANEFNSLLAQLDQLRKRRDAAIVILSHAKVRTFKNPLGTDYDRFVIDANERTTAASLDRWSDLTLFGNFRSIPRDTDASVKKTKGIGGDQRVLYCEQRDGFVAKNRYGMPAEIDLPEDPAAMYATVAQYLQGAQQQ